MPAPQAPQTQDRVQFVVLDDPDFNYRRGDILPNILAAREANNRGVALLPLESEHLNMSGCGGYVARDFGRGVQPSNPMAGPLCPVSLYVPRGDTRIHWRACVVPEGKQVLGQLRLALDGAQLGSIRPALHPSEGTFIEKVMVTESRKDGSYVVGGSNECSSMQDGNCGFSLWGFGQNWRVTWFAVSATRVDAAAAISANMSPESRGQ